MTVDKESFPGNASTLDRLVAKVIGKSRPLFAFHRQNKREEIASLLCFDYNFFPVT